MSKKAELLKLILLKELERYKKLSYEDLVKKIDEVETVERGKLGSKDFYQLEFTFFFDDKKSKNIRVIGSIDDGGRRAFIPLTESFIITAGNKLR